MHTATTPTTLLAALALAIAATTIPTATAAAPEPAPATQTTGSTMGGDLPPEALPAQPYPACATGWWTAPADPHTCLPPEGQQFHEPTPPGIDPALLEPTPAEQPAPPALAPAPVLPPAPEPTPAPAATCG